MSTVSIKVLPLGKTVEAAEGANLFEVLTSVEPRLLDRQKEDKDGSYSHVFVLEGRKGLSKTSREENEKLDTIVGVGAKSRMAARLTVLGTENVTVELLGFDYAGL